MNFISLIILFGACIVVSLLAYGFYEWLNKIELETKYLQSLLDEQEKDKNILRKDM